MSVTGVVTTGIYCRGNCPGRPLPEHQRHFSNAVSAQAAGFRPCLRCRPDRDVWPQSVADVPIEVRAAVQLIADGFLDGRPEDELAHHLGYSARQLRRQDAPRFAENLARVAGLPPAIADHVASAVVMA